MELLKGPYLVLGQSIPLRVKMTKEGGHDRDILLNDFQSMLIETTQIRAHGAFESSDRFWIVQTIANMKRKICAENIADGEVFYLPEGIWNSYALHLGLTSSLEVCNIKRIYELEVRLGFQIGESNVGQSDNL
ncbi:hypothetical protein N7507_003724 [Penicillium longicatenatum]|nr:hypothetical protein N7507_003724 [Penicillium longicatenatum]